LLRVVRDTDDKSGELIREKETKIPDRFNDDGYLVPYHKRGTKMFADIPFPERMTDNEIGKTARLSKLMVSTSNMLGYRCRTGIKPYAEKQLIDIVGLSSYRGKEYISKMINIGIMQRNKRIIGEVESEEFYLNPAYFFAGKRIGLNLYLLFREHLDPVLSSWAKQEFWDAAMEQVKPKPELPKVKQTEHEASGTVEITEDILPY